MNFKYYLILVAIAVCTISACKKHENPAPGKTTGSGSDTVSAKKADVYVSGSVMDTLGRSVAAYCKNDTIIKLTSIPLSEAYAVAINDANIYGRLHSVD